jgi:tripartite-type tricarboxylate transporter receptor subunit TctC
MKFLRRQFLQFAGALAASAALPRLAAALDYPTRPVRIVAGFAAGGGVDITARLIGQWLTERLGQSFVTENRAGAGGNVGTEAVVGAAPDGYTLLLATVPNAVNASLYEKLNFNFIRDIAPVAGIIRVPMVILLNPTVPAKTVPEFIAYAKANPGKINMASAGNGSAPHMAGELFKMMAASICSMCPIAGRARR